MTELESQGHQAEELKKQLEEARHCQATLEDKQQSSAELIRSLQDVSSTGIAGREGAGFYFRGVSYFCPPKFVFALPTPLHKILNETVEGGVIEGGGGMGWERVRLDC